MELIIRTPEREVLSIQAAYVSTRAAGGVIGILPRHAPMLSPLSPSVPVRVRDRQGRESSYAVHGGFLEVLPTQVLVLAESAESAEEIDVLRSRAARERAESRLASGEGDLPRAEVALQRSLNRLSVAGDRGNKD
ncbi:ATP synthase F1 subunit epsilon [Pasteuria penetrans]|uniref:ATP synthase F1 subunit epsilon n=1 Tax=Pasteuria penetrans TaxID=86005 RepID=UPI000F91C40D|nr:ATP synthase F1 subunit epsilon [Pasteuria penetrans]